MSFESAAEVLIPPPARHVLTPMGGRSVDLNTAAGQEKTYKWGTMYVPLSTYRLQLHAGFTLDNAADLAPYLAGLGADTCYTSPYFTANPGSMHGYDVCDHNAINPELGGPEAHARFVGRLAGLGLGHMVDFVPNHMGVGTEHKRVVARRPRERPRVRSTRATSMSTGRRSSRHSRQSSCCRSSVTSTAACSNAASSSSSSGDGVLVVHYFDYVLPTQPQARAASASARGRAAHAPNSATKTRSCTSS